MQMESPMAKSKSKKMTMAQYERSAKDKKMDKKELEKINRGKEKGKK